MTTTAVSTPSHASPNQLQSKGATRRADATALRVLFFDDGGTSRDANAEHLRTEGYEVMFAADAQDFIDELQAHSPDAVVLDLQAQGLEVLRRIRALEIQVPVIVIAERGESAMEATRLGAVSCLAKPADLSELSTQLRQVIGDGRLSREMHLGDEGCPFELPAEGVDLEAVERGLLAQALVRTNGNQSRAARLLGISRYALRYRMQKFKLA
jgi:DNA-binding NtrC family response regulator